MKKILIGTFIIALIAIFFISCSKDSPTVTTPPISLKGAFVLYQSASAGGSDYCFVDIGKDTVFNNLFQNSNGGTALAYNPGGIVLKDNRNLTIVCGGQTNQNGKIYKINSANNQTVASQNFGTNPRCFDIDDNNIYVVSSGGAYITQFDLNLNILSGIIDVSLNPGKISNTANRQFVCRTPYDTAKSIAIINEINNNVTYSYLNFYPIALVNNTHGYFLTGSSTKNVYKMDSTSLTQIDSIPIPTSGTSVGEMIKEGQGKLLVVVDSSEVWEVDLTASLPTTRLLIPFPGGMFKISAIAYEDITAQIYIADNQGGPPYPGKVYIYDPNSGAFLKSFSIYGRNPVGFAFKY